MQTKLCTKCNLEKTVDNFYKRGNKYRSHCKQCEKSYMETYRQSYYEENKDIISSKRKAYYRNNIDKELKRNRAYAKNNRDVILKQRKEYYQENRDSILDYQKQYYLDNRDEKIKYQEEYRTNNPDTMKTWRDNNKEHIRDYERTYTWKNRDKIYFRIRQREVKKQNLPGNFTYKQWVKLCSFFNCVCPACNQVVEEFTIDHIIPITWHNSSNWITNIQPLCRSCNGSKGNFHATDYRPKNVILWAVNQLG